MIKLKKQEQKDFYPLSKNQKYYWYLYQISTDFWNLVISRYIKGPLNISLFEKSVHHVVKKHAILTNRVQKIDLKIVQYPTVNLPFKMELIDLTKSDDIDKNVQHIIKKENQRNFVPRYPPLFHMQLVMLGNNSFLFLMTLSRLICDEYSLFILWDEICQSYCQILSGIKIKSEKTLDYYDVALWQKQFDTRIYDRIDAMNCEQRNCSEHFVNGYLQRIEGNKISFKLDKKKIRALQVISFRNRSNVTAALFSIFNILLYPIFHSETIPVYFFFSGRNIDNQLRNIIGPLSNFQIIHTVFSDHSTFQEILQQVQNNIKKGYLEQYDKAPEILSPTAFPLKVMFNKYPVQSSSASIDELKISKGPEGNAFMHLDLCLYVLEDDSEELTFELVYHPGRFNADTIHHLIANFEKIVDHIIHHRDLSLSELSLNPLSLSLPAGSDKKTPIPEKSSLFLHDEVAAKIKDRMYYILASYFLIENIGCDDEFINYGITSLDILELQSVLEKEFLCRLPLADVLTCLTVSKMTGLILKKMGSENSQTFSSITIGQKGSSKVPPLFFIPGGLGGDLEFIAYSKLIPSLSDSRPFIQINYQHLPLSKMPYSEFIDNCIHSIQSVQKKGPYILCGDCIGGIIAFEIANKLIRLGEKIDTLILMDSFCPARHHPLIPSDLEQFLFLTSLIAAIKKGVSSASFFISFSVLFFIKIKKFIFFALAQIKWVLHPPLFFTKLKSFLKKRKEAKHIHRKLSLHFNAASDTREKIQAENLKKISKIPIHPYKGDIILMYSNGLFPIKPKTGWIKYCHGKVHMVPVKGSHLNYIRKYYQSTGDQLNKILEK